MGYREEVSRVLLHRVRAHRAALSNAAALGWPAALAREVEDTQTRLDECLTLGAELVGALEFLDDEQVSAELLFWLGVSEPGGSGAVAGGLPVPPWTTDATRPGGGLSGP